jgi:Flp pilus assembly protein TadD
MLGWLSDEDLDQLLQAARLLSAGGQLEQALTVVRRVLSAEPDSRRARTLEALLLDALGRNDEAAERLGALLRLDPDNLDLRLSLAWNEMRRDKLQEARRSLDLAWELVRDRPSSLRAVSCCLEAARLELAAGHPLRSREWLDRVGDVTAAGIDMVRLVAATYRQAEDWQEGVAALLRLQPQLAEEDRAEAVAYEAEFRLRMGAVERGLERLRPLLDSDEVLEVLAGLQVLQILERWDDVERETRAARLRLPEDRDLRFAHAAALERSGRPQEAEEIFTGLLADNAEDAATANYLGYMWADAGTHLDEAFELIRRAVAMEPHNPAYIDSLGWVYYRLGDLEQAEHWLRKAVVSDADDGTVLSHLGQVLLARGETDEARSYLLRALQLGCEHPHEVRALLDRLE